MPDQISPVSFPDQLSRQMDDLDAAEAQVRDLTAANTALQDRVTKLTAELADTQKNARLDLRNPAHHALAQRVDGRDRKKYPLLYVPLAPQKSVAMIAGPDPLKKTTK